MLFNEKLNILTSKLNSETKIPNKENNEDLAVKTEKTNILRSIPLNLSLQKKSH